MKNLFSIFFLLLFLFFVIGYKALFCILQHNSELKFEQQLENNNYSVEETFKVKLAISMPYPIHNSGYQKAEGKFEHNGEFYHLVKQKIENDTLHIVCIKNDHKKSILDKMVSLENLVHNFPKTNNSKNLLSSFAKDYIGYNRVVVPYGKTWIRELEYFHSLFIFTTRDIPNSSPPPELYA